jgi:hypothetical protein
VRNVNPKVVQEQLGHSSIYVTMDIYSEWIPGLGKVAADNIGEALSLNDAGGDDDEDDEPPAVSGAPRR